MLALLILNAAILAQYVPVEVNVADQAETTKVEATTQPTTQQLQITVQTEAERQTILDDFNRTRLGRMFRGEPGDEPLTVREVLEPGFWITMAQELVRFAFSAIPRVLVAILFLCVFWLIYRGVRRLIVGSMSKANVDQSIRDMLGSLVKWAVMGFGLVIAFNQVGVQITALLTGVSIIGIAIGFAAQETLANFIAGIVIFWDKPFKIGDWVQFDGELAQVTRVTFRSTRLTNLDNDVVVVPNTMMLAQKVINKSSNLITRASVPIGISYNASIDKAREVLIAICQNDPRIVTEPEPIVEVRACAASSVDLMLHFWIKEEKYEDAMNWELLEKAKKALDAAQIEIPFPHMQVLLEQTPAISTLAGNGAANRAGAN
jgi:small conductance mechanosensitive channel